MKEEWRKVKGFPLYEVSNTGSVRRIGNSWPLSPKMAKGGAWFVKLSMGGPPISKTIKSLVAEAFVPRPEGCDPELWDTPVQLVVDTDVIRADKIVWRPRWFAIQFRRQINECDTLHYWDQPVMNLNTGNQHASILTASLHDGTLMKDIYRSAGEGRATFPDGYRYDFLFRLKQGFGSVHDFGV